MFATFAVISLSLDYRVGRVGSFVTSQSRVARVLDALLMVLDGVFFDSEAAGGSKLTGLDAWRLPASNLGKPSSLIDLCCLIETPGGF